MKEQNQPREVEYVTLCGPNVDAADTAKAAPVRAAANILLTLMPSISCHSSSSLPEHRYAYSTLR